MTFDPAALAPLAASLARAGLPVLSQILSVAAPFPFNLFVGPATSAILAMLGVDPTAPDAAAQASAKVDSDPTAAAKLQTIEDEHASAVEAAQAELDARLKDVQDARATEVKLVQSGSWLANANVILAAIVIIGFFAVTLAVITHAVDSSQTTIYLITVLGTGFGMILNFYYGSSKGSADKTDAMRDIATTAVQGSTAASNATLVNANTAARRR